MKCPGKEKYRIVRHKFKIVFIVSISLDIPNIPVGKP